MMAATKAAYSALLVSSSPSISAWKPVPPSSIPASMAAVRAAERSPRAATPAAARASKPGITAAKAELNVAKMSAGVGRPSITASNRPANWAPASRNALAMLIGLRISTPSTNA